MVDDDAKPFGADPTLAASDEGLATGRADVPATISTRSAYARGTGPARRERQRGDVVGRLVVLGTLGAGGMGVVYEAYDPELDRKVALKFLRADGDETETARARLQREAQAMAKVSHRNVINVHDVGTHDDQVFVAMEFVQGKTLRAWLATERRSWREVVAVFVQVGRGLAAAHDQDLLHRDIKPDNVMVDDRGRAVVMDFGLARTVQLSEAPASADEDPLVSGAAEPFADITRAGALVGTPAYMAPEQIAQGPADERTDQFSYCVALWEALFGERPFVGADAVALLVAVTDGTRQPTPKGSGVPRWLRRAVDRGLSHDPAARWPSMEALVAALSSDPTRRRALAGGVVLAVAGGVGVAGYRAPRSELCTGAAQTMGAVWNDARRADVQAAVLRTDVPYAAGAWDRLNPKLDAWSSEWVAMHTEACESTQRRYEQSERVMDLRMACLHRARLSLDAVLNVLGEATPQVVEQADALVDGLPAVALCADTDALQRAVEPPAPHEAAAVEAIHVALADAQAHRLAGDYDAAMASVRRAEAGLEGVSYEPARTEVSVQLGATHEKLGEYDEAEAAYRRVRRTGARQRQWDVVRLASLQLMYVVGAHQKRYREALGLREIVEGLSRGTELESASLRNIVGIIRLGQGKYAEAEREHRAALALRREVLGDEHLETAASRSNLANTLILQGKQEEAEAEYRAALVVRRRAFGNNHPLVAASLGNLANVLTSQQKYDEAALQHRAALELRIRLLGEDHPHVAKSRNNLANALQGQGEHAEAAREYRAALALSRQTLGEDHLRVALLRHNLARSLLAMGKHEEAETEVTAGLAAMRTQLDADHPHFATVRSNLANILQAQQKLEEAEVEFRASLAIQYKVLGESHSETAWAEVDLGQVLVEQGKLDDALSVLERAWETAGEQDSDQLRAHAAFALATTLWPDRTQRTRARKLAEAARAAFAKSEVPDAEARAEFDAWLAAHP